VRVASDITATAGKGRHSADRAGPITPDGRTRVYRFTSVIKQGIPHEERAAVIEAMWRVVLSDRTREQHEDALMRRVTDLLGLDSRDSVDARHRAQAALGLG
jgi:uncharacterized tellurite resistance protein B-like protein